MNEVIPYKSDTELSAEENRVYEDERREAQARRDAFVSTLAGHIRNKWAEAKREKQAIEQRMLKNKRMRRKEYETGKLQAMRILYGPDYDPVYMAIAETKCRAAEAWIKDILFRPGEEPWDIQPTPKPEIPEKTKDMLTQSVITSMVNQYADMAFQNNLPLDMNVIQSKVEESMPVIQDRIDRLIKQKAKESAEKMKVKIADQFAEGGWEDALEECIYDVVTYKAGFLKGPVFKKARGKKLVFDETQGKFIPVTKDEIIYKYERRSPFSIYPQPGSKSIGDGYIFDKVSFSPKDLSDLIGVPGFKEPAIREVLQLYRIGGLKEWTEIDYEKSRLEDRASTEITSSENIDCLNFWGSLQGRLLTEWGIETGGTALDPEKEYDICLWLIGEIVIGARLNPDAMGEKPYSKASFVEDPDAFWGYGVPELIEPIVQVCNSIGRAIQINAPISAGPITEWNTDRATGSKSIYPLKVIESTNQQMQEGKALNFYQATFTADALTRVYEWGLQKADEDSGIPRYQQGETDIGGGAGDTASGLSMLMTASARGIKLVIKNIDKGIIKPSVTKQYYLNLDFEDISLIGDMKVVARGSSSMIAKEQLAIRRTELMDRISRNQTSMQIIGLKGWAELLKEAMQAVEIDTDKVLGEFEMETGINSSMMKPMMAGGGGQITGPEVLNEAGEPVSGQDNALFQRPPLRGANA